MMTTVVDRYPLEARERELLAIVGSPALVSDARGGDREAADALAEAREELATVRKQLARLKEGAAT